MNEDKSDEDQEMEQRKFVAPHVLDFFDIAENGEQICALCRAANIWKQYSENSSLEYLQRHLQDMHGLRSLTKRSNMNFRQKSVLKHFYKPTEGVGTIMDNEHLYCRKCLENQKIFGYALRTLTTVLTRHLLEEHPIDFKDDEVQNVSPVNMASYGYFSGLPDEVRWVNQETIDLARHLSKLRGEWASTYFMQVPKEQKDLIFCVFCLLKGLRQIYTVHANSTTLRNHLKNKHNFDFNNTDETNLNIIDVWFEVKEVEIIKEEDPLLYQQEPVQGNLLQVPSTLQGYHSNMDKVQEESSNQENRTINDDESSEGSVTISNKFSEPTEAILKYYKMDKGYFWCKVCEKEKLLRQFSQRTSIETLIQHLINWHQIDPLLVTVRGANGEQNLIRLEIIPPNDITRAQRIIDQQPTRPRDFFIPCDRKLHVWKKNYIYCCFCLVKRQEKTYTTKTKEPLLRNHLIKVHNIDPFSTGNTPMKQKSQRKRVARVKISVSQETADMARELSETKGLPTERYFIKIPDEPQNLMFCIFCMLKGFRLEYSVKSCPTFLLRHLIRNHNFDPDDSSHMYNAYVADTEEQSSNQESGIINDNDSSKVLEKNVNGPSIFGFFEAAVNGEMICSLCKLENIRTKYKAFTSSSTLRRHMKVIHGYTDFFVKRRKFADTTATPVKQLPNTRTASSHTTSLIQETTDMAGDLSEMTELQPRKYFIQMLEEPQNLIFCVFCISKGVRLPYPVNTDLTDLVTHLRVQHKIDSMNVEEANLVISSVHSGLEEGEVIKEEAVEIEKLKMFQEDTEVLSALQEPNIHYCRSCRSDNISSIFSSIFYPNNDDKESSLKNFTFGDLYTEMTGVQIHPDDGMPQGICNHCEERLKAAYRFRRRANRMEETNVQNFSTNQHFSFQSIDFL